MSDKDSITKEYMKQPKQFADLFNGYCFGGEEVIRPEELREMDTASIALPYGKDGAAEPLQKNRDLLKMVVKTDGKAAYCLLGVENQSEIHTAMPIRNLLYDAMTLAEQVDKAARSYRQSEDHGKDKAEFLSGFHRGDKVLPVLTIVVHWGAAPWDVPLTLKEMYPEGINPRLLKYVADYKVNLVSPTLMSDAELNTFKSDLKEVLKFIKHSTDKKELSRLLKDNPGYQKINRLAAQTINKRLQEFSISHPGRNQVDVMSMVALNETVARIVLQKELKVRDSETEKLSGDLQRYLSGTDK